MMARNELTWLVATRVTAESISSFLHKLLFLAFFDQFSLFTVWLFLSLSGMP